MISNLLPHYGKPDTLREAFLDGFREGLNGHAKLIWIVRSLFKR